MSDSSRSKAHPRGSSAAGGRPGLDRGPASSPVRTVVAGLLVVLGIAWIVVHLTDSVAALRDLGGWNFVVGFGLLFVGLALLAHPSTPLGRGRGVVVGMLGCFLIGLVWIIVYYMAGQPTSLPLIGELGAYNLMVGIGFMAVGFVYATRWE